MDRWMVMTIKDEQVIFYANEYRFVTREILADLTGRNPKSLNESLQRLVREKRLYRKVRSRFDPIVYATYAEAQKRDYIEHDLGISYVHLALHKTGRLIEGSWHQPREKFNGEINEDDHFDFAIYRNGTPEPYLMYHEHDTGSEGWQQIGEKMARYVEKRNANGRPFRVMFTIQCYDEQGKPSERATAKRLQGIKAKAESFIAKEDRSKSKFFLLTSLSSIRANTLGNIFYFAHSDYTCPIAPDLVK